MADLGLSPSRGRSTASAISANVSSLDHIIAELGTTHKAALNPHSYGIDPGEKTIAPWSVGSVLSARNELTMARTAVGEMVRRLSAEIAAQERVSGNAAGIHGTGVGTVPRPKPTDGTGKIDDGFDFDDVVNNPIVQVARNIQVFDAFTNGIVSIFQVPGAVSLLIRAPGIMVGRWGSGLPYWGLQNYKTWADFVDAYATHNPNWFIRNTNKVASALEFNSLYNRSTQAILNGPLANSARWLPAATEVFEKGAKFLDTALPVAGRVLGGLGVVVGGIDLVGGIINVSDGEATDADKWQVADGVVGVITGIGSFLPPPVGVVFAAVGAAYTLGRFLFTPGDDGKTPIDHMGSFFTDVGSNINKGVDAVGKNINTAVDQGIQNAQNTVKNVANAVNDTLETAGKVFDDLWPW